ncbi:unnamed protein product [Heterobilharzia americana]|nr:unnamed protein product [Heterobilharzia americana]
MLQTGEDQSGKTDLFTQELISLFTGNTASTAFMLEQGRRMHQSRSLDTNVARDLLNGSSLQSPNNLSTTLLSDGTLPETSSIDHSSICTVLPEMVDLNGLCQPSKPTLPNPTANTNLHQQCIKQLVRQNWDLRTWLNQMSDRLERLELLTSGKMGQNNEPTNSISSNNVSNVVNTSVDQFKMFSAEQNKYSIGRRVLPSSASFSVQPGNKPMNDHNPLSSSSFSRWNSSINSNNEVNYKPLSSSNPFRMPRSVSALTGNANDMNIIRPQFIAPYTTYLSNKSSYPTSTFSNGIPRNPDANNSGAVIKETSGLEDDEFLQLANRKEVSSALSKSRTLKHSWSVKGSSDFGVIDNTFNGTGLPRSVSAINSPLEVMASEATTTDCQSPGQARRLTVTQPTLGECMRAMSASTSPAQSDKLYSTKTDCWTKDNNSCSNDRNDIALVPKLLLPQTSKRIVSATLQSDLKMNHYEQKAFQPTVGNNGLTNHPTPSQSPQLQNMKLTNDSNEMKNFNQADNHFPTTSSSFVTSFQINSDHQASHANEIDKQCTNTQITKSDVYVLPTLTNLTLQRRNIFHQRMMSVHRQSWTKHY